jgi:hypothetical protein
MGLSIDWGVFVASKSMGAENLPKGLSSMQKTGVKRALKTVVGDSFQLIALIFNELPGSDPAQN